MNYPRTKDPWVSCFTEYNMKIKLSKAQWKLAGKTAGWTKTAQDYDFDDGRDLVTWQDEAAYMAKKQCGYCEIFNCDGTCVYGEILENMIYKLNNRNSWNLNDNGGRTVETVLKDDIKSLKRIESRKPELKEVRLKEISKLDQESQDIITSIEENLYDEPVNEARRKNMKIKLSKAQWREAGIKAGWTKKAQEDLIDDSDMYDLVKKMKMSPEAAAAKIHGIRTNDKWEICDRCKGHGKIDNPNLHSVSGPSLEEQFAEDPDFKEGYMEGVHDVSCDECHGSGKKLISEPIFKDEATKAAYEDTLKEWYNSARQEAAERSMRARGIQF